jgi:hypothetical protein
MDRKPKPAGFISLKSVTQGAPDAAAALADIRRIYFRTTRQTIENDLAHAIELLKSLPTEEEREKAAVFMEGLAQMRREWGVEQRKAGRRAKKPEVGRGGGSGPTATEKSAKIHNRGTGKQKRAEKNKS